jgi:hypothetical protein
LLDYVTLRTKDLGQEARRRAVALARPDIITVYTLGIETTTPRQNFGLSGLRPSGVTRHGRSTSVFLCPQASGPGQ